MTVMSGVQVVDRAEFVQERFDYAAGDHVVFGGPTGKGKTTLAFELLEYTATPELPAYIAVTKPDDPTTAKWSKRLGYRKVDRWPPGPKLSELMDGKPPGYVVWPKFGDIETDTERAALITGTLIRDRYAAGVKKKRGILVMDDTMVKAKILGLDREMVTMLAMSRAMGVGLWVFVQKPTDSGRTAIWSYGASEHLFLTRDPDAKSRARYDEIGGVDPRLVSSVTKNLGPYQFLYIKRTEGYLCIVDK